MADSEARDYREFLVRLISATSLVGLQRLGLVRPGADADRLASDFDAIWEAAPVEILEVRVNGGRIDARIGSSDGRAWLAVLWVERGASPVLLGATVYERPQLFDGHSPGSVVVLNGPSSVGKSSLMAAFANDAETPWACLDEPWFGMLPARFRAWPSMAGPVADGFLAALGVAARVGNQFIVSSGGISQFEYRSALQGVPTVYVGLDAPLDVLLRRQLAQPDKFGGLAEESVDIHEGWEYDLRIDMASCSPLEAAHQLAAFLAR